MNTFEESVELGKYREDVERTLDEIAREGIIPRIWEEDHTVWKPDPEGIVDRLGWLTAAEETRKELPRIRNFVDEVREAGYTKALLLGMGGSSLAPDVFSRVFDAQPDYLDLDVLDSTAPAAVQAAANALNFAQTLFIVSSKSGSTAETLSFFKFFYTRAVQKLGRQEVGKHFIAITDPGSPLVDLAEEVGFREVFLNEPTIGGRFSVLSYFGMVPAALLGLDAEELLLRAEAMAEQCGPEVPPRDNPGAWLGAVIGTLAREGRDKLTFLASPVVASFGDWMEQLIAESLGKEGTGVLPVVGEPVGPPVVYGDDRFFVYLRTEDDGYHGPEVAQLNEAGYPVVRLHIGDRYDLGGQFFLWAMATAVAGHLLGIHPFNQPNVEAAKRLARNMLAEYQETGNLPDVGAEPPEPLLLNNFLDAAEEGDYVAIQAFVPPSPETFVALQDLRTRLRDRYHLPVTVGYGPRYLHSTGQLHKGDAGNGLFVQLDSDPQAHVPIPDEPGEPKSSLTFAILKRAQGMGDYKALKEAGRRVIRFGLSGAVARDIKKLAR